MRHVNLFDVAFETCFGIMLGIMLAALFSSSVLAIAAGILVFGSLQTLIDVASRRGWRYGLSQGLAQVVGALIGVGARAFLM